MTSKEVAEIVENEGLGYAITQCVSYDDIDDQELKDKWKQAQVLLSEIEDMLPDINDDNEDIEEEYEDDYDYGSWDPED